MKPVCTRCSKASITCVWRTSEQLRHDGRRRTSQTPPPRRRRCPTVRLSSKDAQEDLPKARWAPFMVASELPINSPPDQPSPWSHQDMPSRRDLEATAIVPSVNFDMVNDSALFSYYLNHLLPSTIHESSHTEGFDFSYWSTLAMDHQPLMDVALACGAMSMYHKFAPGTSLSKRLRQKALVHHTSASASIRQFINSGVATGGEDWLLATVESLVLFSHRDPGSIPEYASLHIRALAEIFKCREAKRRASDSQARNMPGRSPVTQFERLCYESLVYHSTVIMWFDKSSNILADDDIWDMLHGYFHRFLPPAAPADGRWPILGVPYSLFKLITIVSRLSRPAVLREDELDLAKTMSQDLASWKKLIDDRSEYSVAKLYVYAADALIQHLISKQTEPSSVSNPLSTTSSISQCIDIILSTNIGYQFSSYHLWPVFVLGSLVTDEDQKQLTLATAAAAIRNMDGVHVPESSY